MAAPEADDEGLVAVAGAVADRTPVRWEDECSRTPERAPELARLKELAALEAAMTRVRDGGPREALFTWGALQAVERLGEGSFAEVWRAWDPVLQREVALKLRRDGAAGPAGGRRWIEEARRLARLRHPHVLAVLGADEHEGRAGLWTELIEGVTLEDWIAAQGPLGAREAVAVGLDLCNALAAVHAAGLVHGDVSLRNVMREGRAGAADRSGRIVLMDFGSAREARAGSLAAFGTPAFTAPEVLEGGPADVRSDVYSLGVVLYRLLTARYPVEPGPLDAMRARLARGERTALRDARPDLPGPLVSAVERACDPDRASRFASAAELEQALAGSVPRSREDAPAGRRATRPLALGVTLAALAVVALLAGRALQRRTAPPETSAPTATSDVPARIAAPPAATPAPSAPQLEASLVRVTAGAHEVLRSGDLVAPGDELALELDAREPVHAYVLSEDETGAVFVLFPLAGRGAVNPLAPGPRRLPGSEDGHELSWQVTSAGGRETFLLLASRTPLAPVAEATAGLPQARPETPVAYHPLPPEALARLRGVGGVVAGPPLRTERRASMLAALARDLEDSAAGRPIWLRLVVLENPAP
ncbi:MAG: protein kinase [Candidatus Eisenbacteria bacterium]|nr:protein kinase [Candidatus Eisenbacteria bacterium]